MLIIIEIPFSLSYFGLGKKNIWNKMSGKKPKQRKYPFHRDRTINDPVLEKGLGHDKDVWRYTGERAGDEVRLSYSSNLIKKVQRPRPFATCFCWLLLWWSMETWTTSRHRNLPVSHRRKLQRRMAKWQNARKWLGHLPFWWLFRWSVGRRKKGLRNLDFYWSKQKSWISWCFYQWSSW